MMQQDESETLRTRQLVECVCEEALGRGVIRSVADGEVRLRTRRGISVRVSACDDLTLRIRARDLIGGEAREACVPLSAAHAALRAAYCDGNDVVFLPGARQFCFAFFSARDIRREIARICTEAGVAHCGWRRKETRVFLPLYARGQRTHVIELFGGGGNEGLVHGRLLGAAGRVYFSTPQQLVQALRELFF